MDIAILVNNAGVNDRNYFKDEKIEDIMEMSVVNTYSYAFMAHKFLPLMKKRNKRSLLLTISSIITTSPAAYDGVYACTKAFEQYQMESLRLENDHLQSNTDFLIIKP